MTFRPLSLAAPPHATAPARLVWDHVVRSMAPAELLSASDEHLVEVYCEQRARYAATAAVLQGHRDDTALAGDLVDELAELAELLHLYARDLMLTGAAQLVPGIPGPPIDPEEDIDG